MDERSLLLLGLLRAQSQHGYQINEFIERNLSRITDMKKATAYATLDRLSAGGYASVRPAQVGNRPPRKIYSITPAGEALFFHLLRRHLAMAEQPSSATDIGLIFLDELSADEIRACLSARLEVLSEHIYQLEATPSHGHGLGVDLALERRLTLLRADHAWLTGVLARLPDLDARSDQSRS